ncbi:hypothetical protein [Sphingomonas lenta]|uniref:Uncharacterized protein n=1 Tax=Sphingomonas lenta TaxID=1141887 RepID=A0A2A2SD84_9SPHN|nr:hypothetical protein [Sphingomonas lenta]PAX06971.1 hypothetical protein CKY28_12955 [Sphingomonas lenta]
MFGIGGFNPVSLLATAAFGPAGGIVAQLATQVYSQFGQQLIQQMGNNLGLPQSAIDMAQSSFAGSVGDFQGSVSNLDDAIEQLGRETGASGFDIGDAQRQASDILNQTVRDLSESEEFKEAKSSGGKGGGWLMAMARALGEKLNAMGEDLEQRASTLSGDDPGASAEFGVVSQQFNMLMNATTNAIKTIGEAMGKAASRQ